VNPVLPYDKRIEIRDSALDGPDFDLAKYRGYAVWINIFATWCPPCREEQPVVVSTAAKYRAQGLRTVGVFANEEDDAIRAYRAKFGISYPLVRDSEGYLTANLQGTTRTVFPSHLFIDGNGVLYCYEIGGLGTDLVENIVTELLKTTESPLPADPEPTTTAAHAPLVR
jgi:thiol-disulfide isomerase/thioredoxin